MFFMHCLSWHEDVTDTGRKALRKDTGQRRRATQVRKCKVETDTPFLTLRFLAFVGLRQNQSFVLNITLLINWFSRHCPRIFVTIFLILLSAINMLEWYGVNLGSGAVAKTLSVSSAVLHLLPVPCCATAASPLQRVGRQQERRCAGRQLPPAQGQRVPGAASHPAQRNGLSGGCFGSCRLGVFYLHSLVTKPVS